MVAPAMRWACVVMAIAARASGMVVARRRWLAGGGISGGGGGIRGSGGGSFGGTFGNAGGIYSSCVLHGSQSLRHGLFEMY